MAKSLSQLKVQIERLQKEAALIQNRVVSRIRKEIAQHGLTVEQLFGAAAGKGGNAARPSKATKYADGMGNTWAGVGKRPGWIREALEAGRSLEDFLVGTAARADAPVPKSKTRRARAAAAPNLSPAKKVKPAAKATAKVANKPKRKVAAKSGAPAGKQRSMAKTVSRPAARKARKSQGTAETAAPAASGATGEVA